MRNMTQDKKAANSARSGSRDSLARLAAIGSICLLAATPFAVLAQDAAKSSPPQTTSKDATKKDLSKPGQTTDDKQKKGSGRSAPSPSAGGTKSDVHVVPLNSGQATPGQ